MARKKISKKVLTKVVNHEALIDKFLESTRKKLIALAKKLQKK